MAELLQKAKANFGTAPVFLTAISTILGAIMFLRFGYAVGNLGFYMTVGMIFIAHMVTIPTALSLAEIATNQKVEGGGEYYIISRSFGLHIGASIGIALYLSQAISVAFYIVALGEAFDPLIEWIDWEYGYYIYNKRLITLPALGLIIALMLTKGADIGMKALYVVVVILGLALIAFFFGSPDSAPDFDMSVLSNKVEGGDSFFKVFAICFPAFTGMTAGVGLSGDLKDPKKSIPIGTLAATLTGMIIYIFIAYKLAVSASPEDLDSNQLVMADISLWGPLVLVGLAAATISSALGSFMVAPRTLQALGNDKVLPNMKTNTFLSKSKKNEPLNAGIVTSIIAVIFVWIGDVNVVAEIISMFFMVTYGSICLISFLQHFSADPAYRPSFKSRWYVSLAGAILCGALMVYMNPKYALIATGIMLLIYFVLGKYTKEKHGIAVMFQGVIFQISRSLQVFLQKSSKESAEESWRPSVVCISSNSFQRFSSFEMMKWISHRYGFGTYIHFINGYFSKETTKEADIALKKLIKMAGISRSNVYLDTLISPSYTSAIAQIIQLPGISGKDNNMLMFEFDKNNPDGLSDIADNFGLIKSAEFDVCILGSSKKSFGYKQKIHIWITHQDFVNANLMILMSYIIMGHKDWKDAEISIIAVFPDDEKTQGINEIKALIASGRLPISANNIEVIGYQSDLNLKEVINQRSNTADLTVLGFNTESVKGKHIELFLGYDEIGDVLFVNTNIEKVID